MFEREAASLLGNDHPDAPAIIGGTSSREELVRAAVLARATAEIEGQDDDVVILKS